MNGRIGSRLGICSQNELVLRLMIGTRAEYFLII